MALLEEVIQEDQELLGSGRWMRGAKNSSLVVDCERQIFYFNRENIVGDVFIWLTKIRGLSYNDAKEYLKGKGDFTGSFIHEVKDGEETVVYPKLVDVFHYAIWEDDRDYFHRRCITDETITRFKLGKNGDFYTIPFYQDGLFKQFQLRKDNPKTIKQYYRNVGPLLFNSDIMKISDWVVITEGVTSAIVLSQFGIPAVSSNVGAEGALPVFYSYFATQKKIFLLFDNDDAGRHGAILWGKMLGQDRCKAYTFADYEEKGYDANNYVIDNGGVDGLMELVDNKCIYIFEMENNLSGNKFNRSRTYRKSQTNSF